jgi:murein DD-endopeptidase MepM/ murein hydrolase activator NlpD
MRSFFIACVLFALLCATSCSDSKAENHTEPGKSTIHKEEPKADAFTGLFDPLLADGFSYPFGNGNGGGKYTGINDHKSYEGWYIATKTGEKYQLGIHTGEDWNGKGGGDTDFGQPVFSTAKGSVLAAQDYGAPWGNVVYIEHHFIENARLVTVYSLYAHLNELFVKKGDVVEKRQKIGSIGTGHHSFPAHLHFEIRKESMRNFEVTYWPGSNNKDAAWILENYHEPSAFVNAHRKTVLPASYDTLLVAEKSKYKMHMFAKGKEIKQFDIALSQSPVGHKEVEGDNKLPEGEYYITEKNKGPFYGAYKAYFGPAWMRISYPNSYDAEAGYKKGIITKEKRDAIIKLNKKGMQPPKNTGLGGGIGIHGWAGDWPVNNRHLTWGCISFKNRDLEHFYDLVPINTKIFILP